MARVTPAFKAKFEEILADAAGNQANETFQKAMDCLREHHLLYKLPDTHCKYFLTHKSNRGGLLISPHNVHRNGANIHRVGADEKQLTNAVCVELAPEGPQRSSNIVANMTLVSKSEGLLASVTGDERYLTLGCGHTAAFCKVAASGGGKSKEASIMDEKGKLAVSKLEQNAVFKKMIHTGWQWEVVPHEVDIEYPSFAKIAQRALNTSNHVSTQVSELEAAVTLADVMETQMNSDPSSWEKTALDAIVDLCLPCSSYGKVLLDFVKLYGGGAEAPQIRFMDAVAKQFRCNQVLGETFWNAITYTMFSDKTSYYPMTRVALGLCNLASDKCEDGVANLIKKSQVTFLASKNCAGVALRCENTLKHAVLISDLIAKQVEGGSNATMQALGKLFVRCALLVVGKGKQGPEGKDLSDEEIQSMFLSDMSKIAGQPVVYDEWKLATPEPASGNRQQSVPEQRATAATLSDHSSPTWIAGQAGFEVGKQVVEKKAGSALDHPLVIQSIEADVFLKQLSSYTGDIVERTVPLEVLIKDWAVSKMEPPVELPSGQNRPHSVGVDAMKCRIFNAIVDADSMAKAATSISFWRKPDMVRAGSKTIPIGALTLAPVLSLNNITTKSNPTALHLGKHTVADKKVDFFGIAPPKPPPSGPTEETLLAGYWWVGSTSVKSEANMEETTKEVRGISVPVLKNCVAIDAFTKLAKYVAPAARKSESSSSKTGPAKKQRS